MWSLLGGFLVKLLGNGILTPILSYLQQKDTTQRDIAVAGIGSEERQNVATVQAAVDANHLKAQSQAAYPWIVYLIAVPPALHAAAVYADSLPFWTPWGAHVVGAWGVPQPPGIYGSMQHDILMSFFVVAPLVQAIRAGTAVLTRR